MNVTTIPYNVIAGLDPAIQKPPQAASLFTKISLAPHSVTLDARIKSGHDILLE